jgi:putative oxidoreductase
VNAAVSDRLPVIEQPPSVGPAVTTGLTALGLAAALYAAIAEPTASVPLQAKIFMVLWLAVSVVITLTVTPRHFTAGFLAGLGAMLIGWRIAALNELGLVSYALLLAFIAFVVQFFDCIRRDLQSSAPVQTVCGWMLTFIRVYVGFDLVPHTEFL